MISKNISKFYKNKKVLITGVTGFKGSWLDSFLLILGAEVYGIASKKKKIIYFISLNLIKELI
jgi:CDP-glucose 4,6-dehydratase